MRLSVLVDHFPALSETFVLNEILALRRIGHAVHVETAAWAAQRAEMPGDLPVSCLDDDSHAQRLRALAWLVARHPVRCASDLVERRRWRREEPVRPLRVIAPLARRIAERGDEHVHVQFAAGAALDALRLGRLLRLPYSVTAHAYDIYQAPANLREKFERARLGTGVSEYSVRDLRGAVRPPHDRRIHVVPMGVDHRVFRRTRPLPGGRTVLAVGRMVEKKGFRHLVDAAAIMRGDGGLERLVLVGDGPLRAELERQVDELALRDVVEFTGARTSSGVREALEQADVLAVSAVPAADGDRDVLPIIVGEALAMEVPVVASDFVGLPEVVRPPWGRLVPPGDAGALARALAEMLALSPEERRAAGAAGRDFVVRTRDVDDAARRLIALLADPVGDVPAEPAR